MYTEEELKEKLLLTNCFNDNEWLDKYINLIINKSLVEKIKYKSAVHHIIPRHYFINENKNIDNSAKNLVYLYQAIIENPHILSVNYRNVLKHLKNIPLPVKKCLISLLDGEIVTPAQLDKYIEEVFE